MSLETVIYARSELPSGLLRKIEGWVQKEFGQLPYYWAWDMLEWYGLALKDYDLIGCLGMLQRIVCVRDRLIPVGGIAHVIIQPQWQQKGIAKTLINRAVMFIRDDLECQYGLLFCRKEIAPFYIKIGWKKAGESTRFEQPSGEIAYSGVNMIYQCGETPWPPGTINLCGLPW